jgi:LmbE family N-acetylglucosaminyl deacetylase
MKKIFCFAILTVQLFLSIAQTFYQPSASEIKQQLKKLNVVGSVLYIAAHPDDENTRLISYLTNEKLYRTGYLSLTRGDGGQNLIGNEQAELLGVIRTQELLAARRIDGGEQFFTRANDFGYSKTPEETFKIWNKDSILAIICRFPTTGEGGHGHHTASAILAEEAFTAAADASKFPEQLKYVQPWQSKRLLWNTYRFGERNTTSEEQFKIDVGGFNSLLGKSYGEIAAESRSKHSSQAFGTALNRASQFEYFKTILGDAPKNDLLDDVNPSWKRFSGAEKIEAEIANINTNFNFENPSASVAALISLYESVNKTDLKNDHWKQLKLNEIKMLIASCSGLWMEALGKQSFVALGDSIELNFLGVNRSTNDIKLKKVETNGFTYNFEKDLKDGELFSENKKIATQSKNNISQPYWLIKNHNIGRFKVSDQTLIGKPENDAALNANYFFSINGKEFVFNIPVQFKIVDPAKGEIYQPFIITPPVTATIENEVYIFTGSEKKDVNVILKTFQKDIKGTISLNLPDGWKCVPAFIDFKLPENGTEQLIKFSVYAESYAKTGMNEFSAIVNANGKISSHSYINIKYDHIPEQTLFPPASTKVVKIDLKKNGKLIGYIKGAGDKIPEALKQIGYDVKDVTEEEILNDNLKHYNAIITGVRAYNTETGFRNWQPHLMKYVENGGTLLIQYNTSQKLVMENLGPYPFRISRDRVTEEDAPVTILASQHPALNSPNKISSNDFDGWIQERGLYFPTEVDEHYTKLFSMNDSGEKPLDASTIVCSYGQGKYVYTSLSFFRELPAGVPGAYRLLVNLLEK